MESSRVQISVVDSPERTLDGEVRTQNNTLRSEEQGRSGGAIS